MGFFLQMMRWYLDYMENIPKEMNEENKSI